MDATEVSALHDAMRRHGIPGELVPVNPVNPGGRWRVLRSVAGVPRDVTAETVAAVEAARRYRPTRGFVVA